MKFKKIPSIVFILSVFIMGAAFIKPEAPENKPPNLLIIIADQYRGQALGLEEKEPVMTPNLDKLGRSSFVSTQMIANYPVCSPSRAMLMSGKYPFKNHVSGNANSQTEPYGVELPKDIICWSDILKTSGYSNGYIGKWHLDSPHKPYIPTYNNTETNVAWNEWTPPDRRHGFDYWYAYGTYDRHTHPMYWDTKANRDGFHYVNEWGPQHEASKAIDFLKNTGSAYRDSKKPFALVVSMNPPHSDYDAVPQKYLDKYKDVPMASLLKDPNILPAGTPMGDEYRTNIKNYYAAITGVDEQVGRILQQLQQSKLDKNTIIVFMSDHGNCLGKHGEITKNVIYEESVRVPFIVNWKGHIKPRMDNDLLMNTPDIYPTLLELLGMKAKIPADLDGKSMAPYLLRGEGKGNTDQFILGSISPSNQNSGFRGVRTAAYKLAYVRKGTNVESYLFDLKYDPFEMKNIYAEKSDVVATLRSSLKTWLQKTNDKFVIPEG